MIPHLKKANLEGKRVLLRADLNVPLNPDGSVRDKQRIVDILPTINYILHSGAKQLVILSHHGRPKGKFRQEDSLQGVCRYFQELAYNMHFVDDCLGRAPEEKLLLMENVRFHPEEEENDPGFTAKLAALGDIFVNDAFASNRAHASTTGLMEHLPSYLGFLYQKELSALSLQDVQHPVVFLLGGAKASTKLPLVKAIAEKADTILLGGTLHLYAYKALGHEIGKSLFNQKYAEEGRSMLSHQNIILPHDLVVATEASEHAATRTCTPEEIKEEEMALDIGPATTARYKEILAKAGTIIWNGPMGCYEVEKFAANTDELARFLTTVKGQVIAGGGDSITVINKLKIGEQLDYVSTGGGATLQYLREGTLPALEVLKKQQLITVAP